MSYSGLVARLRDVVGPGHVLDDPGTRAGYEVDWTGRFRGQALAVVRPGNSAEVAECLSLCAAAGVAVVPQGGNTGLVGGGVPLDGQLVFSLRRLDGIEPVDVLAREVTCGAGVTLSALQAHTREAGLTFGVDLASRGSATIGGMIATNAGGIHFLRYGPMRGQLVGLEAVTASGSVVGRVPGLAKDNSGYSLAATLAGSEGTLAVITAARLRLVPDYVHRAVALLGFGDFGGVVAAASVLRALEGVEALEGFLATGLELVLNHTRMAPPFGRRHAAYLLVEVAANRDPTSDLAEAVGGLAGVLDSAAATDRPGRERLWAYRERHTEAINAAGVPHKLDLTLPFSELAGFPDRVDAVLAPFAGLRAVCFGHVGDGNVHVNILGADPADERPDEAVFRLVAGLGGSISAEHGIGRAKAAYLGLVRSAEEIALMRSMKAAFDPSGTLNPGVIFKPGP